jgi:hypothetical protein
MSTHILERHLGTDPFDLALALVLMPPTGEALRPIDRAVTNRNLFVLTARNEDGKCIREIVHAFVSWDDQSIRVTVQTEDEFPSSADCPVTLIDQADTPRTDKARMWRATCRGQAQVRSRPDRGSLLHFTDGVETEDGEVEHDFTFDPAPGCRGACFVSLSTGRRQSIPYFFDRAYEVLA